jgi:periplasmic divalent cation tolerance protein
MKSSFRVLLVTAPDLKVARRLARLALESRHAACANIVRGLESQYWWNGQIESGREVLLLFKTAARHLAALERLILTAHPYDTPEFLALPVAHGARRYLNWITASLAPAPGRGARRR